MAVVEWSEDSKFIAYGKTSHGFVIDTEGKIGTGPMELMLLSVASCTAIDIVVILKKTRNELKGLKVFIEGKRAEEIPKVYFQIIIKYQVQGNIDEKDLKRAIDLSQEKYCSASIMLKRAGVEFNIEYEILP